MDTTETAASPARLLLRICALVALCLLLAGPARAEPDPGAASCAPGTTEQPLSHDDPAAAQCLTLQMGLSATPNPTPAGGTVSFSWSVTPETDCWDNLGHSAWGGYSFSMAVSEPFTWIVYCTGNGVESATLYVGVESAPPPPPPPPPPAGDHNPKGRLDSVQPSGVATGWACDPDSWTAAIDVRFYADGAPGTGTFLGSATAGLTREAAVGDACGGTRNHGFEFTLPGSVRDGRSHSLYAYAVNVADGSDAQLAGSPLSFQTTSPTPPSCTGIVVLYELPNYAGRCWSFDVGIYPTLGTADNVVSSIRVQDGYFATLFADQGYGGAQWTTVTSADSAGWVDVGRGASSLIVQAPEELADGTASGAPVTTATAQSSAAASGSGCWRVSDSLSRYSRYGRRVFTYALATDFCTNGKTITRLENRDIVVDIPPFAFPLNLVNSWRYAQTVYLPGEKGARSTTLKVQGEFSFCLFHYGCPLSYNQWIKIELSGDGSAVCTNAMNQLPHNCTRTTTKA